MAQPIKHSKVVVDCIEPTRINKYLAQAGVRSRREVDSLIANKKIKLNGNVLNEQGAKVKSGDTIELLDLSQNITVILNKPVGYISDDFSSQDHPPAIKLLVSKNESRSSMESTDLKGTKLNVLGRLDAESRGLLVFSNDGVLAKTLIGPESSIEKEYVVKVLGSIDDKKIALLRHGIQLDGIPLKKAQVELIDTSTLKFILREGKNRQIRRMCEKVELQVVDLLRIRIGKVKLDNLAEGFWRRLDENEVFV